MDNYAAEQKEFWNGEMGDFWVNNQSYIDAMLRPIEAKLVDTIKSMAPTSVLDIGCGNGTTTFAISEALGESVQCTGIDLSKTMIDKAKSKVKHEQPRFISNDASQHDFGESEFDLLCSRFGVMFFSDPVSAFSHIKQYVKKEGSLLFIVWRTPKDDDFMMLGRTIARKYFADQPAQDTNANGPFSWGNTAKVDQILSDAGWQNIGFEPIDFECNIPAEKLRFHFEHLAPIGFDLDSLVSETKEQMIQEIVNACEHFIEGEQVKFKAPCWMVTAIAR